MGLLPGILSGVKLFLHVLAGRVELLANGCRAGRATAHWSPVPWPGVVSGRLCRHRGCAFQPGGMGGGVCTVDRGVAFGQISSVWGLASGKFVTCLGYRGVGLGADASEFTGELLADPGRFSQGVHGNGVAVRIVVRTPSTKSRNSPSLAGKSVRCCSNVARASRDRHGRRLVGSQRPRAPAVRGARAKRWPGYGPDRRLDRACSQYSDGRPVAGWGGCGRDSGTAAC